MGEKNDWRPYETALRVGGNIELQKDNIFLKVENVFGGICPATDESPFYACVIGKLPHSNSAGRRPLILIDEIKEDLPEPFLNRLAEAGRAFFSWHWYHNCDADFSAIESLEGLLLSFTCARDITGMRILEGNVLNWSQGLATIQQWAKDDALQIPSGAILHEQLSKMTAEDKKEARKGLWYAVDALRAVVSVSQPERVYRAPMHHNMQNEYYFG